jgi:hypothetical protein
MERVNVDQFVDALIAAAGDRGAVEVDLSAMRIAAFAGDYVAAITDALQFIAPATLTPEMIAAYSAFRATVTYPDDLALLPDLGMPAAV